jgi:hypothetical protein
MNPLPVPALPLYVGVLAATHQLGALREIFLPSKRMRLILVGALAAFGILLMAFLALGTNPSSLSILVSLAAVFAVAFVLIPAVTGPLLNPAARERKIYVFEQGLVRVAAAGAEAYRFDMVSEIHAAHTRTRVNGISTGVHYRYLLTLADGRRLKLGTYATDMSRLGPVLQIAVAKAQVPRFWQLLVTGAAMRFGKFTISMSGIGTDRKPPVAWSQIKDVQVFNGRVSVNLTGKWLALGASQASKISNLYAFLTLAEQLRGYAASAARATADPIAGLVRDGYTLT